ncbi:ABC transporter ATP-binding protein [Nordella sp. HKS 07]|uniref:ABC transporter ATP-binding protein n=1 Tax=Nordella sp. HKS 07 TaxID=2712222 RepID=UPI0013E1BECE|nr:ABC transporter ATP-binding protein [Nordella sp. HKS 07]QIG51899.1 ABC transporter ATP-binding protein [Nordella sp. HKS 07]
MTLLSVRNLAIALGQTRLVEDVDLDLEQGQVLGLVGESGSGKSLTCQALMRLLPPELHVASGEIILNGRDLSRASEADMRQVRGTEIGMIFQNPSSRLDPVMTIGEQITESIRYHEGASRSISRARAIELLRQVGIPDAGSRLDSYPHEFSGGMRQRVMIAMALACRPKVLIADEPTTALDVTVQAQVLRLLLDLRDRLGLAILLVTHNLGVVAQTCDWVYVMYAGRVMERGPKRAVLREPAHPYTEALLRCQPGAARPAGPLPAIPGQAPPAGAFPAGCRFHPRCPRAEPACHESLPVLQAVAPQRLTACPLAEAWRAAS